MPITEHKATFIGQFIYLSNLIKSKYLPISFFYRHHFWIDDIIPVNNTNSEEPERDYGSGIDYDTTRPGTYPGWEDDSEMENDNEKYTIEDYGQKIPEETEISQNHTVIEFPEFLKKH